MARAEFSSLLSAIRIPLSKSALNPLAKAEKYVDFMPFIAANAGAPF
jgi:hypothetical protein